MHKTATMVPVQGMVFSKNSKLSPKTEHEPLKLRSKAASQGPSLLKIEPVYIL